MIILYFLIFIKKNKILKTFLILGFDNLIPLGKKPGGSTIELSFQITPPFILPFTEEIYNPDILIIKLEEISGIILKKPLKKAKLYFNLKLEKDSNDGIKSKMKEEDVIKLFVDIFFGYKFK